MAQVGALPLVRSATPAEGAAPMPAEQSAVRSRRLIGVGVVVFITLLHASTQFLSGIQASRVLAHLSFLAIELPTLMLALSATYGWTKRRQLGAGRTLAMSVAVAGVIGATFGSLLWLVAQRYPTVMLRPFPNFTFARGALYGFTIAYFHFGLWALAFAYPFAIDEARLRELETSQLRSAAELARLRAHLEPHFLLNTLNAIAGLVTDDPREARRLIACLGDLLRDALRDDDELETITDQIAWLQRYAAILQARHAGALDFEWDVADDVKGVVLPRLLLQPLVENAVKHGALRSSSGEGKVAVRIAWEGDALACAVTDNGPGVQPGGQRPGGFGLHSVMRRTELKYPGARVWLDPSVEGTTARVGIPRVALDGRKGAPS